MPNDNPKSHRYQKLGGVLLFIVVIFFLQVVSVATQFGEGGLMDVLRRWDMFIGAQGILLAAGQVVSMLLVIIYVFAAFGILQRDPHFLRTRQLAFAAIAVNLLLQLAGGLLYGFGESGRLALILQAVIYAVNALIAMLYYTRSVRVRTYMGSDEYLRVAFFTKKAKGPAPAMEDRE